MAESHLSRGRSRRRPSASSRRGSRTSERSWGIAACLYLATCLLLGGASAAGAIANAALQLAGVVLIVLRLWSLGQPVLPAEARPLLWIFTLLLLVGAISLMPLPSAWWQDLPGRSATARGFALLGMGLPSVPLSLAAERTAASLLWLLPVAAMFLLTVHLSSRWRRRLSWVLLGTAVVSVALSAFQLIGGEASPLRPYQITNPNRAVGFFASANHLPTLILCALPFAGLLAGRAIKSRTAQAKGSGLTLALAAASFLLVGIVVSGSAAGYGLLVPTALASFLVYKRAVSGQLSWPWAAAIGGLLLVFIAVGTAGPVGKEALAGKFSEHPTSRSTIWENSLKATEDFFPFGSGLGTFSAVYRTYEDPARTGREYVNHAHNDYLEVVLELGIAGLLLVIAFLLWWLRATARAWRNEFHGVELARAGSVMVGLLLLHSVVDYPLRTSALAAVFAMACAFLMQAPAPPARSSSRSEADAGPGPRHLEAD